MKTSLTLDSSVVAAKEQVSSNLADEAVILGLKKGVYYGLNPVGATVWNLIQKPRRVDKIRDTLLKEYEIDAERCERDLMALLKELSSEGLVEIRKSVVISNPPKADEKSRF